EVHRALTGQAAPDAALAAAATHVERVLANVGEPPAEGGGTETGTPPPLVAAGILLALAVAAAWMARSWRRRSRDVPEAKVAWAMVLPAVLVVAVVAGFPLLWTAWESLHAHDLRTPWRGRPFVGLANY